MTSCLTLFLGGTVGESQWRDKLIPLLEESNLGFFNPVVKDWNESARLKEYSIKGSPLTVEVYVITKGMLGVFSIAEAVDDSNKKPEKTIFCVLREGFEKHQLKSLDATEELITKNGAFIAKSLEDIARIFKSIEWSYRAKRVSVLARKEKLT